MAEHGAKKQNYSILTLLKKKSCLKRNISTLRMVGPIRRTPESVFNRSLFMNFIFKKSASF